MKSTTTLVSHSICGKIKTNEAVISSRASTKVVDDEVWTTFYYADHGDNCSTFRRNYKGHKWKSIVPILPCMNSLNPAVENGRRSTKRLQKEKDAVSSTSGFKNYAAQMEIFMPELGNKMQKISWRDKRPIQSDEPCILQEEANRERSSKKNRIRRWLNMESPETILENRIKRTRYDFSTPAAEAAIIAGIRSHAKKAAKAGAFAAAAFARVVAEEMSPRASHGSIADSISDACKDVARTSLVQKTANGDYLRLHHLFHYHFKFRGPNYYRPLEPRCYHTKKSNGRPVVHCKMDEPVETFRSNAIAKDSPLVLFLKQVAEGAKAQASNDTNYGPESNEHTKSHGDQIPPVEVQSGEFFSSRSGNDGSGIRSQAVTLEPNVEHQTYGEDYSYSADKDSVLAPIKYFLETLNSKFDENVDLDNIEKEMTIPRAVPSSASQFKFSSQYLSIRTSSVGIVR